VAGARRAVALSPRLILAPGHASREAAAAAPR
jgi:hypothetical protein